MIATACRDGERIRFRYRGRDGAESRRDVEPHSLVNSGRRWYLLAWDRGREDWRTFRLDRLERATAAGVRAAPREPPGGDAAAFVSQSLRAAWSRYSAHVTLHAGADEVRARAPWAGEGLTPLSDGRCEYRTADDDLDWLAVRIAALGVELEVHGPPELIEHLRGLSGRLTRALAQKPEPVGDRGCGA